MKKNKLSLFLVSSLVSVAALTACSGSTIQDPTYSKEGNILTYTDSFGNKLNYTAEDLFGSYFTDKSSVESMFDIVYKLIVRNYFKAESKGIAKYNDIVNDAKNDVDGVKNTATKNSESNKTSWDEEWQKLLNSNNAKDEDDLLEHFIYERELKEFERQFYEESGGLFSSKTGIEFMRDAKLENDNYEGYIEKKVPYHVRHVLVKLNGTSSSTNYWNDTIDADDAHNLYSVAFKLAKGELSFGEIAQQAKSYSDGSSDKYGDLGIMDKDTSFVNEFKLGIYAYENLYSTNTDKAEKSEISMDNERSYSDIASHGYDISGSYSSAVTYTNASYGTGTKTVYDMGGDESGKISTIPLGAFEALESYANTTASTDGATVNGGDTAYYPRNIIFNKYLNKHFVSFITPNKILSNTSTEWTSSISGSETTTGENTTYDTDTYKGFKEINGQKVLCTTNGNPILVVRAGSSGYQGIHFIVIERSALEETKEGQADINDYYSIKYPNQTGYISDKTTYVNFLNQKTMDIKSRAEEVESKIKEFDSNINKLIYQQYVSKQKIKFNTFKVGETEYDLGEVIDKWIEVDQTKTAYDSSVTWEDTWETYINSLNQQKAERRKLISEVCAIGFTKTKAEKTSGANSLWNEEGGACYVPSEK